MKNFYITTIKNASIVLLVLTVNVLPSIQAQNFAGGSGIEADPYEISTVEQLQAVQEFPDKYFILTGNIDASATANWDDGDGGDPDGFVPIGTEDAPFTGHFNGQGYVITGLFINRPATDYVGLFGFAGEGTSLTNTGLEEVSVIGHIAVGALAGVGGDISNSYSTGSVTATDVDFLGFSAGGLVGVGVNIQNCFSSAAVHGEGVAGGLVGFSFGLIENSYSTGPVTGSGGSLIGTGFGNVKNSYSTSSVTGSGSGLVGSTAYATLFEEDPPKVFNSFLDLEASGYSGSIYVGTGDVDPGKTTFQMKQQATYTGWDFTTIWAIDSTRNSGYPYLQELSEAVSTAPAASEVSITGTAELGQTLTGTYTFSDPDGHPEQGSIYQWFRSQDAAGTGKYAIAGATAQNYVLSSYNMGAYLSFRVTPKDSLDTGITVESALVGPVPSLFAGGIGTEADPYQVSTVEQLQAIKDNRDRYFILVNNIDASATSGWNSGAGFVPVGNYSSPFIGQFDGQGFMISSLTINRPSTSYVGLFGVTGSGAAVSNTGVEGANITGASYTGGLVGYNVGGSVSTSYASGSVSGKERVGGLVGVNRGSVSNSYASGPVNGANAVGGLVGWNSGGSVSTSYASGSVSGSDNVGGLVGVNNGSVSNSFWDTQTSGQSGSAGGTGKTLAQMQQQATYTGWDFTTVWAIDSNRNFGYPFLQELSETVSTRATAPVASEVSISGMPEVGQTLTGSYSYSDADGHPEQISAYQWFRSEDAAGTGKYVIAGATTQAYVPYSDDIDAYLSFLVIPKDSLDFGASVESALVGPVPSVFADGSGTEADPYQVSTVEQLQVINYGLDKYFILINDIDASATATWDDGDGGEPDGFVPIGTEDAPFTGHFNGQGYVITGLFINRPGMKYVGLFGNGNNLTNIGLEGVSVTGHTAVGALAGVGGDISNSYSTGSVTATDVDFLGFSAGGLVGVGVNIQNCFSSAAVHGEGVAGGLVGFSFGLIENSYSTGPVTGSGGSLIGTGFGNVKNSYSTSSVTGSGSGLVGSTAYATLFEEDPPKVFNSFLDLEASGHTGFMFGTGKSTAQMQQQATYAGWNFDSIWAIDSTLNSGYPFLQVLSKAIGLSPEASAVSISGTAEIGQTLTGSYIYSDPDGHPEQGSTYQWFRSEDAAGTGKYAIAGATAQNYVLSSYNMGAYLSFRVTPKDSQDTGITVESALVGPVPSVFAGGIGTESKPYEISTVVQLQAIKDYRDRYYILVNNIDASATVTWDDGDGGEPEGFVPIGTEDTPFTGQLDGQEFVISSLTINRPSTSNVGLFGATGSGAAVSNTGVEGANITGGNYTGGLVGRNNGSVNTSYASGLVSGESRVGGLVGTNRGSVSTSYASGSVNGEGRVGGLMGINDGTATVSNSYASGSVSGSNSVGGLVGNNSRDVSGSYATGSVSGNGNVGGLVGVNNGSVSNSFWDTQTSGQSSSDGGTGKTLAQMQQQATYIDWDFTTIWAIDPTRNFGYLFLQELSETVITGATAPVVSELNITGTAELGQTLTGTYTFSDADGHPEQGSIYQWFRSEDAAGTGKVAIAGASSTSYIVTTADIGGHLSFRVIPRDSRDFGLAVESALVGPVPSPFAGGSGTEADPYEISTVEQLQAIKDNLDGYFILVNDIDASATVTWDDGDGGEPEGFMPIGATSSAGFTGHLDGQGYVITGLFINRPATDNVGLFGVTYLVSTVSNLGLEAVSVKGKNVVGSLAGFNNGTISDSYVMGVVAGEQYVGGLVGNNDQGTITDSYAAGSVAGSFNVGGLAGDNDGTVAGSYASGPVTGSSKVGGLIGNNSGGISYSYATGLVTGSGEAGGLIGYKVGGTVSESVWDTETTGRAGSPGGTGKTTAEMQQQATYAGWDFTTTWTIDSTRNSGYPFLQELSETVSTAPAASEVSITGTAELGQTLTGSYTFSDADGHPEHSSTYQWFRSEDAAGTGKTAIAGADSLIYALTSTDVGSYISFVVTPKDSLDTGVPVESAFVGPVPSLFTDGMGTQADPYEISTVEQLQAINNYQDGYFILVKNIDASATATWDDGDGGEPEGFVPIGTSVTFTGQLDGKGHVITGLFINRPTTDYVGLFRGAGEGSILSNIGLEEVSVTGRTAVGALAGVTLGDISNSYSTGSVTATHIISYIGFSAGGLVGVVWEGKVQNCFSSAAVYGVEDAGGLVGFSGGILENSYANGPVTGNSSGSLIGAGFEDIKNSYSTSSVIGSSGGLVGNNSIASLYEQDAPDVFNSFLDIEASGYSGSIYVGTGDVDPGKTTFQMKQQATYTDWDFTTIWAIDSTRNSGYPYLQALSEKVSSGPVASEVSVTGSPVSGATLTGTYTYNDINDHPEQSSTYQWFRSQDAAGTDKAAIAGATDINYTVTATDAGTHLSFRVTPKDSLDTGVAVESNLAGPVAAPEIHLRGNALSIASGDTAASSENYTDFGSVPAAEGSLSRSFHIINEGDAVLSLGPDAVSISGSHAADFTVFIQPEESVSGGDSTSFTIAFDASLVGERKAVISITSNDPDENPYTFAIKGTGTNTPPVITPGQVFSIAEDTENDAIVGTVAAADADEDSLRAWTIKEGNVEGLFVLDAATGELRIADNSTLDFENTPSYTLLLSVSDGTDISEDLGITIRVTNINDHAPVISSDGGASAASVSLFENSTLVTVVLASDADTSDTITYSISGGADQALFEMNEETGVLSFIVAPDAEAPADDGEDNIYEVSVRASDGVLFIEQAISVTVNDVNELSPEIISAGGEEISSYSIDENIQQIAMIEAIDGDAGASLLFTITDGADQTLFAIDETTGTLTFIAAPDYESPADGDTDNVYEVEIGVSDGDSTATQTITVTITDVNEFTPVITSETEVHMLENGSEVLTVTATDEDTGATLAYGIAGGADELLFVMESHTGTLSFITPPDFEAPADAGNDNIYEIEIEASDGDSTTTQLFTITVTDVNEGAPVITSSSTVEIPENNTEVLTVTATDTDGTDDLLFSLSGGNDQALFEIDEETGGLSFKAAPDFEAPTDTGKDNIYEVEAATSDGDSTTTQLFTITVTDVNEGAPVITSPLTVDIQENETEAVTVTATDVDSADSLVFNITGGADQTLFTMNETIGTLIFKNAPDFENPGDANADNIYEVEAAASDGDSTTTQLFTITVTDVNEGAPVITSPSTVDMPENEAEAVTVTATDVDSADSLVFNITGGADQTLFTMDETTGAILFKDAPDFENPGDANADNIYEVEVRVSDGDSTAAETVVVTITDVNEFTPVITSEAEVHILENGSEVLTVTATDDDTSAALTYKITGGADELLFVMEGHTGILSFITPPDFEAPADAGNDNIYEVDVKASDGEKTAIQSLEITVGDANEFSPVITSLSGINLPENSVEVITITASDGDAGASLLFTITDGADQTLFAIDEVTGALTFIAAPDYESPADSDTDNVYEAKIAVSDGDSSVTQTVSVTITDVNEFTPVITSETQVDMLENESEVIRITATDEDATADISYVMVGGADQALFTLDAANGALSFINAPDYENPTDSNGDHIYKVSVGATDGVNTGEAFLSITVSNVNEFAPVFTSSATVEMAENPLDGADVMDVDASDEDNPSVLSYSIISNPNPDGDDESAFTIDPSTGLIAVNDAGDIDREAQAHLSIEVEVSDGEKMAKQTITVNITDVNEFSPLITSEAEIAVIENTKGVLTVTAMDADSTATLSYALVGGADQGLFTLNGESGVLTFIESPDYEHPEDGNKDNLYEVEVGAGDEENLSTQLIKVTITDENESAPEITSPSGITLPENTVEVLTVIAKDEDGTASLAFSLEGGPDQALFNMNAETGVLSFRAAPDFESPDDAGSDNIYEVEVGVSEGENGITQLIRITVSDVNEFSPAFTSASEIDLPENSIAAGIVTATDGDSTAELVYRLTGGADQALFVIDEETGALRLTESPDFENPGDSDADNIYVVEVEAGDGEHVTLQIIRVNVTDVNENVPEITSPSSISLPENTMEAATVTATDTDGTGTLIYRISGGTDRDLFIMDTATGLLTFQIAPDYETPADATKDNIYEVEVRVSDADSSDTQAMLITVADVNEFAPVVTSSPSAYVYEGTPAGTLIKRITAVDEDATALLQYTLEGQEEPGGDEAAPFALDAVSGELTLTAPGDLNKSEHPVLVLNVQVTDGDSVAIQILEISVRTPPAPLALFPEDGAIHISTSADIIVAFDETVEAGDLSGITLTDANGSEVSGVAAIAEDSTLTISHDNLDFAAGYRIRIPAGAILNGDGIGNKAFEWAFFTIMQLPAPVVLVSPANRQGAVDWSPVFSWRPNERAASFELWLSPDSLFVTEHLELTGLADTSAWFEAGFFPYTDYYWKVRAANEAGNGPWSGTQRFVTRAESPALSFPSDNLEDISIAPFVAWNSEYENSRYELQLSESSGFEALLVDSLIQGVSNQLTGLTGGTGYYWRVRIMDPATSSEWSPVYHFTTRVDPFEEESTIFVEFGEDRQQSSSYRMIGMPGTDALGLEQVISGTYKEDWRAFTDTGSEEDFLVEYTPDNDRFVFTPGHGFWILGSQPIAGEYTFTPVTLNQQDGFGIDIHPGWNIISNPYLKSVEWELVSMLNDITGPVYGFDRQFYQADTLKVFEGYYFYNDPAFGLDTLFIPYTGFAQLGLHKAEENGEGVASKITVGVSSQGYGTEKIELVYPDGANKEVQADDVYHPGVEFARYGIVLKEEAGSRARLSRKVVSYQKEGEAYDIELKSEPGSALTWKPELAGLPGKARLLLVNTVTREALLMEGGQAYSMTATEPLSRFTLYVGDADWLAEIEESLLPNRIELRPNYPNPFNPSTTINYALPEEIQVRLEVFDILGRIVAVPVSGRQAAGWHKVHFDGSGLASGVYFYRLHAGKKLLSGRMTLIK